MLVTADLEEKTVKNANVEQLDSEYDLPALNIFLGLRRKPLERRSETP